MEKRFVFCIIAFFFGELGIQEFVLGNTLRGVLGILFCWTFIPTVIAIVQIIRALCAGSDQQFRSIYPGCKL
ncbi:MAG: NINE protein [Bacteroidales bacterium]|nr:NINE protein [Candidatus Colimorpha onthohippi]